MSTAEVKQEMLNVPLISKGRQAVDNTGANEMPSAAGCPGNQKIILDFYNRLG
jgi:hypothetical protein